MDTGLDTECVLGKSPFWCGLRFCPTEELLDWSNSSIAVVTTPCDIRAATEVAVLESEDTCIIPRLGGCSDVADDPSAVFRTPFNT